MKRNQRRGCGTIIQNVLAILFLMIALLVVAGFIAVFFVPDILTRTPLATIIQPAAHEEEAAPTPTAAVVAVVPPTATQNSLLPTWTPPPVAPTAEIGPTNTRRPPLTPSVTPTLPTRTPTPTPTNTPTSTPTETPPGPSPTAQPTLSAFPFTRSNISPFYLQNFANNAKCNWLGIAGEVLDLSRNPVPAGSFKVHVWGSGIDARLIVGSAPAYSPSGWEQFVFDSPVVRDYNVQLESTNGTAVSQVYSVQTRASCNQNLLRIDFIQNH